MAAGAESKLQQLRSHIRAFPDFPKKGVVFRDICPILKDAEVLKAVIDLFEEHVRNNHQHVDLIVGLDARGFLFGPLLAQRLAVGFVLVRKKGKLPGPTVSVAYDLEYGKTLRPLIGSGLHTPDQLSRLLEANREIRTPQFPGGESVVGVDPRADGTTPAALQGALQEGLGFTASGVKVSPCEEEALEEGQLKKSSPVSAYLDSPQSLDVVRCWSYLVGPCDAGWLFDCTAAEAAAPLDVIVLERAVAQAEAEMQADAVAPGQKVLLIDDLLATGGTLKAACDLMKQQQAEVLGCMVVIELKELNGGDRLKPHDVFSLVQF